MHTNKQKKQTNKLVQDDSLSNLLVEIFQVSEQQTKLWYFVQTMNKSKWFLSRKKDVFFFCGVTHRNCNENKKNVTKLKMKQISNQNRQTWPESETQKQVTQPPLHRSIVKRPWRRIIQCSYRIFFIIFIGNIYQGIRILHVIGWCVWISVTQMYLSTKKKKHNKNIGGFSFVQLTCVFCSF